MKAQTLLLAGLLTFTYACNDADNEADTREPDLPQTEAELDEETIPANMAPEFVDVLDAHGGLPNWTQARAISFLVRDFPTGDGDRTVSDYHKVNLKTRDHQIEGEGYVIVSRGDSTWTTGEMNATGVPPRMYQGASFYFASMPFVFADKGITVTYEGETEYGDEVLDEFIVAIPDDMGDGGNDFQLFADTSTHQLKVGTWQINYPAVQDMNLRQMVQFNEWQDVDGVILPSVITLFTAPDEITDGTPGATIGFERVALSERPFAESVFATPEEATVDNSAYGDNN